MRRRWILLLASPFALAALHSAAAQPFLIESANSSGSQQVALIVLRDEGAGLEAAVAPARGGELSSLRVRFRGVWTETLYLARDYSARQGWSGKAPLLWPATGRTLHPGQAKRRAQGEDVDANVYEVGGQFFPMSGHGFARDFPWKVEEQAVDRAHARLLLSFADSDETRRMYPFGFRNTVEYVLGSGRLEIRYRVRASEQNSGKMPFSLGNHITFVTPLVAGTDPGDVVLITPSETEILKENGIPTGETRPRSHDEGFRLAEFERRSAVSLTGYSEGNPYVVLRDPQGLSIRLSHRASRIPPQPVVLFNLWGDAPAGFFSPEPWVGLQNSLNLRQGLIYLDPGEEFDWSISITADRRE